MNKFEDIIVDKLVAYRNASRSVDNIDSIPENPEDDPCYQTYEDIEYTLTKFHKLNPLVEDLLDEFVNASYGKDDNEFLRDVVSALCDELEISEDYVDIICKEKVNEYMKNKNIGESNHKGDWCNCPNCGERIGWDDYDDEVTCDDCGETFSVSELASDDDEEDVKSESNETTDTNPKICLTTYGKYNSGESLGEWIDLTEFSDYEDFVEHCHELFSDEHDPEFMVVDFEFYPKDWYHEAGLPTEEEFYNIQELSNLSDIEKEAYSAYLSLSPGDESIDAFRDAYHGEYTSDSDLGYEMIDMGGMPEHPDYYFDMERFGRDMKMDFSLGDPEYEDADGEPQDPDWYYDSDGYRQFKDGDDAQIAEAYIDGLGGVEQLGKETIQNYFDYEQFGRDLRLNDFNEVDGYLFWM